MPTVCYRVIHRSEEIRSPPIISRCVFFTSIVLDMVYISLNTKEYKRPADVSSSKLAAEPFPIIVGRKLACLSLYTALGPLS